MDNKQRTPRLHIMLISVHGLIRGHDLELGRDADTGGQTTYVLELARALARDETVDKVDLLTRLIDDPDVSPDYAVAEENLAANCTILRLPCGPKKYLRKESLWPHLDQMVDRCLQLLRQRGRLPDVIHTHYADAGYVGRQLSLLLGIPQVHTAHSLGKPKRARLLASGRKAEAIDRQYHFATRIDAEEDVLVHAACTITSTRQEIEEQYAQYRNCDWQRFAVIPPGTDTTRFSAPGRKPIPAHLAAQINRFLDEPAKPMILTIARAEVRKNLGGLVAAFAGDPGLRERANLVIVAGTRGHIREMEEAQRKVLQDLLLDIDRFDLWGSVAIPKEIAQYDVPDLYRMAARRRGVFINSALTEPFGLTLIEAAASGLPIVAPDDGGPRDIVANCGNGLLVDTLDTCAIAGALNAALSDRGQWEKWAANGLLGVKRHYSWGGHVSRYLKEVRGVIHRDRTQSRRQQRIRDEDSRSLLPLVGHMLVSDIDNTLIGDAASLRELMAWLKGKRKRVGFGIASGRSIDSALAILKKWHVRVPDVLITSVGSEIHYGPKIVADTRWAEHIGHLWRREDVAGVIATLPGLVPQAPENQRQFKLSYDIVPGTMPPLSDIRRALFSRRLHARLIYSHGQFLDVLPIRASKGHAIRYLAYRWGLPLACFLVSGDSGNDSEMLVGDTLGVVVGNHSAELDSLRGREQIYFASAEHARGILEGLEHYGFAAPATATSS